MERLTDRKRRKIRPAVVDQWWQGNDPGRWRKWFGQQVGEHGSCWGCQRRWEDGRSTHVGHLINFLFGGSDDPSNLVLICGPCNLSMPMFGPGRREEAILWVASTPTAEDIVMLRTQRLMMLAAGHLDSVAGLAEALCEANPPLEPLTAGATTAGIVVEPPSPDGVGGVDEDGEDPLDPLGLFARAQLHAPAVIDALSLVDQASTRVVAKARAERQKGGRPQLGLRAEGKELVEDEEEVATINRIVELRVAGLTYRRIAETLAAEGRITKGGGKWHPEIVRRACVRRDVA